MHEIIQRHKKGFWYANVWHKGIRLRDCLRTDDRKEAQKILAELYVSVERGEYLQSIETCFKPHAKDSTKLIHPRLDQERKKTKLL